MRRDLVEVRVWQPTAVLLAGAFLRDPRLQRDPIFRYLTVALARTGRRRGGGRLVLPRDLARGLGFAMFEQLEQAYAEGAPERTEKQREFDKLWLSLSKALVDASIKRRGAPGYTKAQLESALRRSTGSVHRSTVHRWKHALRRFS